MSRMEKVFYCDFSNEKKTVSTLEGAEGYLMVNGCISFYEFYNISMLKWHNKRKRTD